MELIYTKPYSPQSKAKIERWFHTMKETWMRGINWVDIKDIDELNDMLNDFVTDYNNKVHSSLKINDRTHIQQSELILLLILKRLNMKFQQNILARKLLLNMTLRIGLKLGYMIMVLRLKLFILLIK